MGNQWFRSPDLSRRAFLKRLLVVGGASSAFAFVWAHASSLTLGAARLVAGRAPVAPVFVDGARAAGIVYTGKSWGAAWGDFNGDGHLDVWTDNHTNAKSLWVNNGNGTFRNIGPTAQPFPKGMDTHGASWGDFNNDGHLDLIQLADTGDHTIAQPYLLVGDGTRLVDESSTFGLSGYTVARGRTPLWFDFDGDGLLDLFVPTLIRAGSLTSAIFKQASTGFMNVSNQLGFNVGSGAVQFGIVSHLMGDNRRYLLIADGGRSDANGGAAFPGHVYDISTVPFTEAATSLGIPQIQPVNDAVVADFNNDGVNEIFTAGGERPNDVLLFNSAEVHARLNPNKGQTGFTFQTAGNLTFALSNSYLNHISSQNIFIGAAGANPTASPTLTFEVDPGPTSTGIQPHQAGAVTGVYIGYTPSTKTWEVSFSCTVRGDLTFVVKSTQPITNVIPLNFDLTAPGAPNHYLVNVGGTWTDMTAAAGLNVPSQSVNCIAADLNNDGYLDLYVVNTRGAGNLPNDLYLNNGNGTFTHVPSAGGAAGTTIGRGCTATWADYDEDGNVDILVTNGRKPDPFVGPYQLFRSSGVGNNWIEIDLVGRANLPGGLDAYGTRVNAVAGTLSMYREKTSGMHERGAQDSPRIHFGLSTHATVDKLIITWPGGIRQEIDNLSANQIVRVTEPASQAAADRKPPRLEVVKPPG